jgi:hypothetical protein
LIDGATIGVLEVAALIGKANRADSMDTFSLSAGRAIPMVAAKFWILLALVLSVAPAGAEPTRIAYSAVSASGTPVWLAKV